MPKNKDSMLRTRALPVNRKTSFQRNGQLIGQNIPKKCNLSGFHLHHSRAYLECDVLYFVSHTYLEN